jgi:hypothetical protein
MSGLPALLDEEGREKGEGEGEYTRVYTMSNQSEKVGEDEKEGGGGDDDGDAADSPGRIRVEVPQTLNPKP